MMMHFGISILSNFNEVKLAAFQFNFYEVIIMLIVFQKIIKWQFKR